ncbi:MFS transporter [Marmoricola sp. OAE513]|uniref:CynX/NimT family MFS transporter n=1 Tax=Marmoricola sp. OAE513 TaxID=2817894 RepID=UPI001DB6FCFB
MSPEAAPEHAPTRFERAFVVLGIVVLAFNLRPAAVSVGPVLDEVSDGLGMASWETALLTTLPVLSFATVGALAPRVGRVLGTHRATLAALALVCGGLIARAHVDAPAAFLLLSFTALSGMAVANVLLPSLVKLHFPDRVGTLTAVYSTAMAIGLTSASVLTVPFSDAGSAPLDWRHGLVVWAFTAGIAALPWIALVRHDRRTPQSPSAITTGTVAQTRLGWLMAGFFGLQSLQAYAIFGWLAQVFRDAGSSAHEAGLLLGITTAIAIPLSFVIPGLTARSKDQRMVLTAIMAFYPIGYAGLIAAPDTAPWLWALTLGIGTCTFPFILTLIGLRARTPGGTAALSGFTQSAGYLIAVVGPFGVGALHDAADSWTLPLLVLVGLCVPQYLLGLLASRPTYVEDEIPGSGRP